MTTEEQRAYNRQRQREWRQKHPEYKEKAKEREQQRIARMTEDEKQQYRAVRNEKSRASRQKRIARMTEDERQQYRAARNEKNRKWASEHRELLNRASMEAYAREFNCIVVPNTPDVQAALESVSEECKKIVQKARGDGGFGHSGL